MAKSRREIIRRMNGGAPKPAGITPLAEALIPGKDNLTLHRFIRECEGSRPKFIKVRDKYGNLITRKLRDARHDPRDATLSRMSPYGQVQHLCAECLAAEHEGRPAKGRARSKRSVTARIK